MSNNNSVRTMDSPARTGGKRLEEKTRSRNSARKPVLVVLASILVVVTALLIFLIWTVNSYKLVYPNITFNGESLSGLTREEAGMVIGTVIDTYAEDSIDVVFEDMIKTISSSDAGAISPEIALETAMGIGRTGSFIKRASEIINVYFNGREIVAKTDCNRDCVTEFLSEFSDAVDREKVGTDYKIGDKSIVIDLGLSGRTLDMDRAVDTVISGLQDRKTNKVDIEDSIIYDMPDRINLLDIYNKIYVQEIDAHLEGESKEFKIVPDTVGVRFDLNAATKDMDLLFARGGKYEIPIIFTEPSITLKDFEDSLFRDVLAECKTTLNANNINRTGNVRLSADALDGLILNPGEIFSYNGTVGKRTYERGYKDASVYVSDGIEDQLGGGICQTSSTLYMVVIRSALEIVERYNHSFTVVYAPLGEDATVYWGSLDFKFANNRDMPIKLEAYQKSDYVVVRILGTKHDDYITKIETNVLSHTPYETSSVEDPTLPYGTTKQKVEGHSAYRVETFRVVYDKDGNVVEKVKLPNSRYKQLDRVLLVGTKNAPTAPPEPTVDPAETTQPATSPPPEAVSPSVSPEASPTPDPDTTGAPVDPDGEG